MDDHGARLEPADVPAIVRGYTIMNDLDTLDQQGRTARKVFDGAAPLGPWIETEIDPLDVAMHTDVAGERRQEARTESMLFGPTEAIAYLSQRVTLKPGDVVSFGSPANPGLVEPGDEVAIEYGVSARSGTRWSRPSTGRLRELDPRGRPAAVLKVVGIEHRI